MEGSNITLFLIVAVAAVSFWSLGVYLIAKSWVEEKGMVSSVPTLSKEPEKKEEQVIQEEEVAVQELQKEGKFEEMEITIEPEKKTESPTTQKEIPPKKLEVPIKEVLKDETSPSVSSREFYHDFGKANIIEFPAEYINENSVRGLDGKEVGFIEFAKNCYNQIGFECLEIVLSEKKEDRIYKVNIFDLVCDHYASDEQAYIDLFGENKEKFSKEIQSIKASPEFVNKNMKELVRIYKSLPQLIVWNDKELFLVLVKPKHEDLTQKELQLLKEVVIQKKLIKAKIFRIIEKKTPEAPAPIKAPPIAEKPPVAETVTESTTPAHRLPSIESGVLEDKASAPYADEETPSSKKISKKPFTKREIGFLKKNRDKMSNEEMAEELNRTPNSITHKLSRLGFSRETFDWTKDKEGFLKNNFKKLSYSKLAKKLGTTVPSVRARCKKLGFKK